MDQNNSPEQALTNLNLLLRASKLAEEAKSPENRKIAQQVVDELTGRNKTNPSTKRKPGHLKDGTPLKVHADKMAQKLVENLNKNVREGK